MARGLTLVSARPSLAETATSDQKEADPPNGVGRYLPALDGLRALAVGAVIAYHLALPWARGGYLGVDLFFVLSGFLITGLLIGEREHRGRIDLRHFYSRRARRLLPAVLIVLTVTSVWVGVTGNGVDLRSYRADVLAALGYAANWRFVFSHQGYFDQFSTPSPLRHMWSLAIEEQFYVLWPLLLGTLFLLGRGSRRVAVGATVAISVASLAAMALLFHPGTDPSRVYYGTDTRAFELLGGALLALAVTRRRQPTPRQGRWLHAGGALSLLGLVWMMSVVRDGSGWLYRGGFLLAATLAVVTIWSVSRINTGPLGAALSVPPLRWVGRVSYGLYLWHWPVIVLLSRSATGVSGNGLRLAQVGVTVAAAATSFYAVERPVRAGFLSRRQLWVAAPLAAAVVLTTLAWGTSPQPATVAPVRRAVLTPPIVTAPTPPPLGLVGLRTPTALDPLRVLIVGDSVMYDAGPGIAAALEATGVVRVDQDAIFGMGLTRTAYDWRAGWAKRVAADHPDLVIGLFGGWDGPEALAKGPDWYALLADQADTILSSGGARVLWLEYPRNEPPDVAGRPPRDQVLNERQRQAVNGVLAAAAVRQAGTVSYLTVGPVLDENGTYAAFLPGADGTPERVRKHDNIHFCPAGAERVGGWVLLAMQATYGLPAANAGWRGGSWRLDPRYDNPHGACA